MQDLSNSSVISNENGQIVITPEKRFDYFTCHPLKAALENYLMTSTSLDIIINLAKVQFMDMTGIKLLVNLSKLAQQYDLAYKFINISEKVRVILDLTNTQLSNVHYASNGEN